MKRMLAGFMAVVLTAACPAFMQTVSANALEADSALPVVESVRKEETAGCDVFSIEVTDGIAEVTFETMQDAELIVAAYNDAGTQMLASGSTVVSPNDKSASAALKMADGGNLPAHFYLRGMLVDPDSLRPLCSAYESPVYTNGFRQFPQEASCSGIHDYPLAGQNISGNLDVDLVPTLRFGSSQDYQYAEIKLEYFVKAANLTVSEAGEQTFVLPEMKIAVGGGKNYAVTPEFTVKSESIIGQNLSGTLSGTAGFYVMNGSGIHSLTSAPFFKTTLDKEGELSFGLSFDIQNVTVQDDNGRNVKLGMKGSVIGEAKGKLAQTESAESVQHNCTSCLDGDIFAETKFEFLAQLPDIHTPGVQEYTYQKSCGPYQTGDFYVSSDGGRSDCAPCPQCKYKTTTVVMDADRNCLENASVQFDAVSDHSVKTGETVCVTTDKNGRASAYLANGSYDVTVTAPNYGKKIQRVGVQGCAKSVAAIIGSSIHSEVSGDIQTVTNVSPVTFQTIQLGFGHSGGITQDGSLYMWGMNEEGQLGLGKVGVDISVPTKVDALENVAAISLRGAFSAAITADRRLYMWGTNESGRLGIGNKSILRSSLPVEIEGLTNVAFVSLGIAGHGGAVTGDGSLYMWGNNSNGQLGIGNKSESSKPVKVETLKDVTAVSLGRSHSAAITSGGSLYMWGSNSDGQLGNGDNLKADVLLPEKVLDHVAAVSLGDNYSAAVTNDGSLYMWGNNSNGQLGTGNNDKKFSPVKVLDGIKSVCLGIRHSAAITNDGTLYTWGSNDMGQLGNGDTTQSPSSSPVKIMDHVKSVSLGTEHSGAVTEDGALYMWGGNICGELGIDNNIFEDNSWIYYKPVEMSKYAQQHKTVTKKISYTDLIPNGTYNCYIIKRGAQAPFSPSNLLYLAQGTSDSSGLLSFENLPEELVNANVDICLAGTAPKDLSAATVQVSDLKYNGRVQYVQPAVSYNGRRLTYGKDYELLKDYSAKDPGSYTVVIHGIGNYTGYLDAAYRLDGQQVESVTLSLKDASVAAGNTLQLTAKVLPEDAVDKSIVWSSGNTDIAVVDQNGLVTAKKAGQVTITAAAAGGKASASCVLTVTVKPSGGSTGSGGNSGGGSAGGSGSSGGGSAGGSGSSGGSAGSGGNSGSGGSSGGSVSPGPDLEVKLLYYIVYFDANSGNKLSRREMTLLYDDSLGVLPKVQRENYAFNGWYTQKSGGKQAGSRTVLNASATLYAHWDKITRPSKVQLLSLASKKSGQCTVGFKAAADVSGYEISYSVNKQFKAAVTKKVLAGSNQKTLTGLKTGKTYYVRVRAYRTDSAGRKIYGVYSNVKKIKIKK